MSTKNSKNVELQKEFDAQIKSGKPFVFAMNAPTVSPKDGKTYVTAFVAQAKKSAENTVNAMFLGWDVRIVRATRNMLQEIAGKYPVGTVLEGLTVQSVESFKPKYDKQKSRINPTTGEIIIVDGKPVYEHTELVLSELAQDFRFPRTAVAKTAQAVGEAKAVNLVTA